MNNLKKKFNKFAISNELANQVKGGVVTITCRNSNYQEVIVQELTWAMAQMVIRQNGYTECGFVSEGGF